MRDYRFIALTFAVGMLSGMWFLTLTIGKANWIITTLTASMFAIWGVALFSYMKTELEPKGEKK